MKTYANQRVAEADTLQSKTSKQGSANDILQTYKDKTVQRQDIDEDELLQGKFNDTAQLEEFDEDELLQGKFDTAQREEIDEDELLQGKFDASSTIQKEEATQPTSENNTGMSDNLKNGVEALSGYSMDDVRVHYNSAKPAQLQALAYAQGTDIHIAPGQEQHLPHEAWHVVQQMQGRVQPTMQLQGVNVNDNEGFEKEADVMGGKAVQRKANKKSKQKSKLNEKFDSLEKAFDTEYNKTNPHPTAENIGAGPASIEFITTQGQPSSNHHIFPKKKLIPFAKILSKMQIAISSLISSNDYSFNHNDKRRSENLLNQSTSLVRKYGMNNDGSQTLMGDRYYWLNGNLFVGIHSGYRIDDPGAEEEKKNPRTMPFDKFEKAKRWGRNCALLTHNINDLIKDNFTIIRDNLEQKEELEKMELLRTSQKIGEDWMIEENSAYRYLEKWGVPNKQYEINNSGENHFKKKIDYQNVLCQPLISAIRNVTSIDEIKGVANGHVGLQVFVPSFRACTDSENERKIEFVLYKLNSAIDSLDFINNTINNLNINKYVRELRKIYQKYRVYIE